MKWEYRADTIFEYETAESTLLLNKAGKEGWELVSVVAVNKLIIYYFKRPGE